MRKCKCCGKLKKLSKFYKYKNGRPHAICIECTKKRANANYNNRPKQAGMSNEAIEAYLKAHPIQREAIRQRRRIYYAD